MTGKKVGKMGDDMPDISREIIPHPDVQISSQTYPNQPKQIINKMCNACGTPSVDPRTGECVVCSELRQAAPLPPGTMGRSPVSAACPKCGANAFFPESGQCMVCRHTEEATGIPDILNTPPPLSRQQPSSSSSMTEEQLTLGIVLRDILSELKTLNKSVEKLSTNVSGMTNSITAVAKEYRAQTKRK